LINGMVMVILPSASDILKKISLRTKEVNR
jgi:hypothetical protein